MTDTRHILDQIDNAIADTTVSPDAMRVTTDPAAHRQDAGEGWELIDAYTRADALGDGSLVDVSAAAREAGVVLPVALTRAVWEGCVAWTEADNERLDTVQDADGRLWDVVWMLRQAISHAGNRDVGRLNVHLYRVPRDSGHRDPAPCPVRLLAAVGGRVMTASP